jgi:hypothetical protein
MIICILGAGSGFPRTYNNEMLLSEKKTSMFDVKKRT